MLSKNAKLSTHSLLIALICSLFLLSPIFASSAIAQTEASEKTWASATIPSPLEKDVILLERFITDTPNTHYSEDNVQQKMARELQQRQDILPLTWWQWSDETASDWPDDDAKARAGQLRMPTQSSDQVQLVMNSNIEQFQDADEAIRQANNLSHPQVVLELTGKIILTIDERGQYQVKIQAELLPLVNLSDDTMLYIFLSEDNAEDIHGRQVSNLIRDMKPEVGFSVAANNITNTTWTMSNEHLQSAGIDLQEKPLGWHLTLAFFGSVEDGQSDNEATSLLALYNTPLPSQWSNTQSSDFLMPIVLIVLTSAIALIVFSNSSIREKGMPEIIVAWKKSNSPVITISIKAGNQNLSITQIDIKLPWKGRGGFKQMQIGANVEKIINLSFKQTHHQDLSFSITMAIEELGGWTQHLRISPPTLEGDNQQRSVEEDEKLAEGGEPYATR